MARFELAVKKTRLNFNNFIFFCILFYVLCVVIFDILTLHTSIGMAARTKHKQEGNAYTIELQLESDNAFMNDLSVQPRLLGSNSRSDTNFDIESIVDNKFFFCESTDSEDTSPVLKHKHDFLTPSVTWKWESNAGSKVRSSTGPVFD